MPNLFILLSSAATVRYKQDILRALAVPKGERFQFRYATQYVDDEVLKRVREMPAQELGTGIVCFDDGDATVGETPLRPIVPVRLVHIRRVRDLGASLCVELEADDFICASSDKDNSKAISLFTSNIDTLSKSVSPRLFRAPTDKQLDKFLFAVNEEWRNLGVTRGTEIKIWEKAVWQLQECMHFVAEPFFFTVLGVREAGDDSVAEERLKIWPEKLSPYKDYVLSVYHFSPKQNPVASKLTLLAGSQVAIQGSPELRIDSRYDLKKWRIAVDNQALWKKQTWLRVAVGDDWEFDLDVWVKSATFRQVLKLLAFATFFSAPRLLDSTTSYSHLAITFLIGLAAGATVIFGLPRMQS
jgi:hypothetical protein